MHFFDASAVLKRYVREAESAKIRPLLAHGDVAVSRLTEVEVSSALNRLAREGVLTAPQRDRALAMFLDDLARWQVVEITARVTSIAVRLLERYPLRSSDAIQLAAALLLQAALGVPLSAFVAYDTRILTAAREEHFTVLAP